MTRSIDAGRRPAGARARPGAGQRGAALAVVGTAVLVVFLLGMLLVVAALTFSVRVTGHSMMPTIREGDRLEVDVLHRHDVARFDVVQAHEPGRERFGGGQEIVKRVIGMPGDRVSVAGGATPRVYLQPRGSRRTYLVDNPTWAAQAGGANGSCCTADGTTAERRTWVTVPEASYWLIGDNWGGSTDSRVFGFVSESDIQATIAFRLQPLARFGRLARDVRLTSVQN